MMTTPQDMSQEKTPPGGGSNMPDAETGIVYQVLTRLIAWIMFMGFMTLVAATVVFIGLALYQGIIWLWPGGVR